MFGQEALSPVFASQHSAYLPPEHLHIVLFAQAGGIVAQLVPPPALAGDFVRDTQPTMAFEAGDDEKVPNASRSPQAFGAVPAVQQNVRPASCHRLVLST